MAIILVKRGYMAHRQTRTYTAYSKAAVTLLASLIKLGRKQKKWSESELAERAGVSRATLQKIEKGDLHCEIGLVFEVASLVGVHLFETDLPQINTHIEHIQNKIALLPQSIRKLDQDIDDDF
jgi:DNA-binding XRE family transcriptional regulator